MNVSIKHQVEATPKLFKAYQLIEHKRVLRLDWDLYRQVSHANQGEQQRACESVLDSKVIQKCEFKIRIKTRLFVTVINCINRNIKCVFTLFS